MRILYVSYGFPPRGRWGSEFYTHQLATGIRARGHEVCVLHPVRDGRRPRYTLEELVVEDVPVFALHNGGDPRKRFADSYENARVEELFAALLRRVRPDLVHFTYFLWGLSAGLPGVCRAAGVPSVVTLTDYGLLCHRGQMFDAHLRRCGGPHPPAVCARCVRSPSRYDGTRAGALARRWAAGALAAVGGLGRVVTARDVARREAVLRRVVEDADLFVAPTGVMERTVRAFGVPPAKLLRLVYAFPEEPFVAARVEPSSQRARFGYLGQFMPHKGLSTLLEATRILSHRLPESVEPWEVWLWGEAAPGRHRGYARELFARDHGPRVWVCQPFEPFEVSGVLGQLSAVVVPSLWDENAPLTALQARAAGVPVLGSDVEGIAEIVEPGKHGLLFPPGDARALADCMREVVLGRLGRRPEPSLPLSFDQHVARLLAAYGELVAGGAARAAEPAPALGGGGA